MKSNIRLLEQEWAKHKYSVLAKSQTFYQEIRHLLKQKDQDLTILFYQRLEQAYALPPQKSQLVNAYQHVYGYFKKFADEIEKKAFKSLMAQFSNDEVDDQDVRAFLHLLAMKYDCQYLLESDFFNVV